MPFSKSPAAPAPRNAGNSTDAGRASGCHFNVVPLHRGAVRPTADELLKAASDFPDLYAAFRPDPIEELRNRRPYRLPLHEELAELFDEVRQHPLSHALVAVLTIIGWTLLLLAPILWTEWF